MESPRNINIEINSSTIVKGLFFLLLAWFLFILKDLVLVVLTAVVIASAVEPPTQWLMRRGISRVFSVVAVYVLLAGILAGIVYTFIPLLLRDTSDFLSSVPTYIDKVSLWNPLGEDVADTSKVVATDFAEGIAQSRMAIQTSAESGSSIQGIVSNINDSLSNVSQGFIQTAGSIFGGILGFILIAVLSFYLAVQEAGVEKFLRIVTPISRERYILDLWKRTQKKIGLWMQGQLVLALLVGVLVFLGLTVLGVQNALLFAVLAALLEIIPLFGPIIAAIPAVASSYSDGGASAGLLVVGLYLIIHQFENHLIYPLVVTKIVGVPPILVILSLLIGWKLAGFLGIVLSVPASVILVELLDDVARRKIASS
jgi:predicted PurR-regulated permease PerM